MKTPCIGGLLLVAILSAHASAQDPDKIRHSGFEDFSLGTLGGAGVNLYVSHKGQVKVINQWDINRDGYNDVLISNDHNDYEVVDALIYWNSDRGLTSLFPELWREMPLAQVAFDLMDKKNGVTRLPAFGGGRSILADLNRDGYSEIVFCNYIHNYPGTRTAFIYWGSRDGYARERKSELPTEWAAGVATADLNGDGYLDLVFANFGFERGLESISREKGRDSFIYWGSATGFDPTKPTLLPTQGAVDVTIGDFNKDGRLDLAFINNDREVQELQVFWGDKAGYSGQRSKAVPIPLPTSVRSGDINGDGVSDLVVTTAVKQNIGTLIPAGKAEPAAQQAVYLVFGGPQGISSEAMQQLPSSEARDSVIGDFNSDGFVDLAVANTSNGKTSEVSSFVYWGSVKGLSPANRTELPTLGATGVVASDLNGDGYADLTFANSTSDLTCDVPSYVYWGSSTGFAPYLRSTLQSFGAASVSSADLNGDGKPEVILVNRDSGDGHGKVNTQIYWGNPHHYYSPASMTGLPGHGAYDTTVADLNDDGFNDLVISNAYGDLSYLYWGSAEGFSVARRSDLPAGPALVSSAVDLNRDGYLDLLFTGTGGKATILWGSGSGYSEGSRTVFSLKMTRSTSHKIADLNRDGYLDLVFQDDYTGNLQILWGSSEGYAVTRSWDRFLSGGSLELADLNADGFLDFIISGSFEPKSRSRNTHTRIFYGTSEGTPSAAPPIELEGYGVCEASVADLNRDGVLDLVLSNYMSDSTRSLPAFIYWGSKEGGYDNSRRTDLPAESSCGIQTLDLNRDGYPEIVVHNHLKDGRHSINSYIYWNGPKGFDKDRRTELPTFGPHYSQWTDPGNLYTRKLEEEYVSAPMHIPEGKSELTIQWKADEPHGAKLKFQVRTADNVDGLATARWTGPNGFDSFYEVSGGTGKMKGAGHRWLQYRAIFSSPDAGEWPSLEEVAIVAR